MPPRRRPALPPPRASIDATTCPEGEIESSATNGPSRRRRRGSPPSPGLATGLPPRVAAPEPRSDDAGVRRRRSSGPSIAAVLEDLPDDLIAKILLLLPQDDPCSLLSASRVCTRWLGIVTVPGFLRRPEAFHRTPTVLGLFDMDICGGSDPDAPRFITTTASAFSLPSAMPYRCPWELELLDCRHGRALFFAWKSHDLIVWEPLTGERWLVPKPPGYVLHYLKPNAVVVCAVKGCDHRCCQGGPFLVVFVVEDDPHFGMPEELEACVYSSVTGEWGEWLKIDADVGAIAMPSSILIGRNLYFRRGEHILEYDLDGHRMSLICPPWDQFGKFEEYGMAEDDGRLGVFVLSPLGGSTTLSLWSMDQKDDDARWARRWVMQLDDPLQLQDELDVRLLGFAEGVNLTFIQAHDYVFTIDLKSEQVKKHCKSIEFDKVLPLVTTYRPGPVRRRGGEDVPSSSAGSRGGEQGDSMLGFHAMDAYPDRRLAADVVPRTISTSGWDPRIEADGHQLTDCDQTMLPVITSYRTGGGEERDVRLHEGEEKLDGTSSAGGASSTSGRARGASANEARRKSSRSKKPNTKFIGGDWATY